MGSRGTAEGRRCMPLPLFLPVLGASSGRKALYWSAWQPRGAQSGLGPRATQVAMPGMHDGVAASTAEIFNTFEVTII